MVRCERETAATRPGDEPAGETVRPVGDGPMVRRGFARLTGLDNGLAVGFSRMPTRVLDWREPLTVGPDHHLVFSYMSQRVDFEGTGTTVVTPSEAVLCPPWQVYRRKRFFAQEEVTVFVAFTSTCADQLGIVDARVRPGIRLSPVSSDVSLGAWYLAHRLTQLDPTQRPDLEHAECALRLLTRTQPAGVGPDVSSERVKPRTRGHHQRLVEDAREHLAASFTNRSLPLRQIAREVGASPYHLARLFRAMTGRSIHEYRTDLRLRFVLARLPEDEPLSDLALAAGFSSPGHLSDVFRRHFQISPSGLRSRLRRCSRTNLEAGSAAAFLASVPQHLD
jgi:AraC-like DNA-binding protein